MDLNKKPIVSLVNSYVSFILFSSIVSWYYLKKGARFIPASGSPVIAAMSLPSAETLFLSHRHPPWNDKNNCLTNTFTYTLWPKCVIYNNENRPSWSRRLAHSIGARRFGTFGVSCITNMQFFRSKYHYFHVS